MGHPPNIQQSGTGGNRWLLACGVGCGAMLLVGVLGVIAVTMIVRTGLDQAVEEMKPEFASQYEQLKNDEKVPAEHVVLFDRLFAATQHEEASMWTIIMGGSALVSYLEDGEVTEEESAMAQVLADYLEQNPSVTFMQVVSFVEQHPEFQQNFAEAQRHLQ